MKKLFFLSLACCIFALSKNGQAQNADMLQAHVRMINASVQGVIDARMPAFAIKPEVDVKLLNAMLECGGHYNIAVANLESWYQGEISNPKNSIVSNNINQPYSGYEVWIGGNFFSRFNSNANIVSARSLGGWTTYTSSQGSRVIQLGGRVGLGSIKSKTNIYDQHFDLQDVADTNITAASSNQVYNFERYSNTNVNYFFVGIHSYHVSKIDALSDRVRGGSWFKYYLDLIIPTQVTVDDMYAINNEKYKAIPKDGDNWKQLGYRIGMKRAGTGTISTSLKLEIGKMITFSSFDDVNPNSGYFVIGLGIGISPKVSAYNIE